jgi:hypothetical protein
MDADGRRWKRRDGEKAVRLMYPGRSGQGDWRIISSKFTSICVYLRLILLHIANPADPQNFQGSYTWDEENSNHGGTRINTDEKMGMMLSSFFKTSQNLSKQDLKPHLIRVHPCHPWFFFSFRQVISLV